MMEAIKDWLNGNRHYATGVALYLQYGKDVKLRNLFNEPIKTAFKEKKLVEVLLQLYSGTVKAVAVKQTTTEKYLTTHKTWQPGTDAILNALREQWRPLYGLRSNLKARIHDVALAGNTDTVKRQEAAQMAAEIISISKQINKIYAKKSYYEQHGKLPLEPVETDGIGDAATAYLLKKNAERYLRRLHNFMAGTSNAKKPPNPKQHEKWLLQYRKWEKELLKANIFLNRPHEEGLPGYKNQK